MAVLLLLLLLLEAPPFACEQKSRECPCSCSWPGHNASKDFAESEDSTDVRAPVASPSPRVHVLSRCVCVCVCVCVLPQQVIAGGALDEELEDWAARHRQVLRLPLRFRYNVSFAACVSRLRRFRKTILGTV